MNYMIHYCLYEQDLDVYKIQDTLEDIMDEDFETICQDGSPEGMKNMFYINDKFCSMKTRKVQINLKAYTFFQK